MSVSFDTPSITFDPVGPNRELQQENSASSIGHRSVEQLIREGNDLESRAFKEGMVGIAAGVASVFFLALVPPVGMVLFIVAAIQILKSAKCDIKANQLFREAHLLEGKLPLGRNY